MAKSFIPPSDLSFDAYKTSLKTFLKGQQQFKDYDFEGSNIAVLIDLLTYNTFNQAHYLNMVGSEMFLDSAQLRESIVSHAKELNYVPRSRISSRAQVVIEVVPNDSPAAITIPKYYPLKTTSTAASTLRFLTDQPIVLKRDLNGRYISDTITVYEGIPVTEAFTVQEVNQSGEIITYNQRFNLQSENIDISSIEVSVQIDENDLNPVVYKRATTLYGLDGSSKVFFVRGYKANNYEIEFGDGVLGAAVYPGNIITVTYRDTQGDQGNGTYVFTKTGAVDGYSAIYVTTTSSATGGSEREDDDSIKYNAVRHFQVQDRAVIESDYEILIKSNFPEIQQVYVYGGEVTEQYGKVIVVLKPYNIDGVVDDGTKSRIIQFLKTKSLVPEPLIQDPEYFYLGIDGTIYYDIDQTTLRRNEIVSDATNALVNLNNSVLGDFDVDVYQSTINTTIMSSNPAITGCDIKMSMIRRLRPVFGLNTAYTFTTNNQIVSSAQGEYQSVGLYGVTTNLFQTYLNDVLTDVVIQDNGIGDLFLFQLINGNKVKVPVRIGSVDYQNGTVQFTTAVHSTTPNLQVTCKMVNNSLSIALNKFITIDGTNINLGVG